MDSITALRILATLASFAAFIAIACWAYSRGNRERFDEDARIPFQQD